METVQAKIAAHTFNNATLTERKNILVSVYNLYMPAEPTAEFMDKCFRRLIAVPPNTVMNFDFSISRGHTNTGLYTALVLLLNRDNLSDQFGFDFDNCPEFAYMIRLFACVCQQMNAHDHPILSDFKLLVDPSNAEVSEFALSNKTKKASDDIVTETAESYNKFALVYQLSRQMNKSMSQLMVQNFTVEDELLAILEQSFN